MTREEIYDLIDEEGVEFIRLQFTDIFGRLKNIAVTPGQMDRVFNNKCSFEGSAIFGERYEFEDKLFLKPILRTFAILPWRPQQGKVAKIQCEVCQEDGTPSSLSTRFILEKVLKDAEKKGYSFMVDPECEFFLFHTDENGLPTTTSHEMAGYLDVGPSDFGENARREIVLLLEEMGFEIESSHHEQAPAQHEIDFKEEDAMTTADQIQSFRFAVRSIAKRFGLYATFMPKPKTDVAGSGMHTNITVLKDGKNIFRDKEGNITDEAYYFMGGIIKHARALSAIANPTVNSYKRLLSGYQAPGRAVWSSKGEKAYIKLKKYIDDAKLELRFPDGSTNPYLLLAACVAAGLDGIEQKMDPGNDAAFCKERYEKGPELPNNLKEAIDELKEDQVLISALGEEFTDIFTKIKYAEWKDYMVEVSAWELNRYLTRI